jgi:crossover junction endodeoxyribonuclease RusA
MHQPREDGPRSFGSAFTGVDGAGGGSGPLLGAQEVFFRVEGMEPAPQGSKRHLGNGVMVENCKRVKPWRLLVADAAVRAGASMLRGPVAMSAVFLFARPMGHYRKDGSLKPSAPEHHAVKPDGSKLIRSTEDALSRLVFEDDSRIVTGMWHKRYCVGQERPGAIITITQLKA